MPATLLKVLNKLSNYVNYNFKVLDELLLNNELLFMTFSIFCFWIFFNFYLFLHEYQYFESPYKFWASFFSKIYQWFLWFHKKQLKKLVVWMLIMHTVTKAKAKPETLIIMIWRWFKIQKISNSLVHNNRI